MHRLSDAELFELLRKGNKDALAALFSRFYDNLLHYGCRITQQEHLVEECIQELFLYIFESHNRLGDVKYVKAYLYRSLHRRILQILNKERHRSGELIEDPEAAEHLFSEEDFFPQEASLRQSLKAALNSLPSQQREAIYLRYYNNLSTKEIAEVMGVANQTVLNTLYLALKKIRNHLSLPELILTFFPLARLAFHCA